MAIRLDFCPASQVCANVCLIRERERNRRYDSSILSRAWTRCFREEGARGAVGPNGRTVRPDSGFGPKHLGQVAPYEGVKNAIQEGGDAFAWIVRSGKRAFDGVGDKQVGKAA